MIKFQKSVLVALIAVAVAWFLSQKTTDIDADWSRLLLRGTPNENYARELVGRFFFWTGAFHSMTTSVVSNPSIMPHIKDAYQSLFSYLETSGIYEKEIKPILNARFASNQEIVGRIQRLDMGTKDRRDAVLDTKEGRTMETLDKLFSMEEAKRYVKYAVAAYGDAVIVGTKIDTAKTKATDSFSSLYAGNWTQTNIAGHVGVPVSDVVLFDAHYSDDPTHLRSFLVVDHAHQKIVLAIRGTMTHSEIAIDFAGYSRPFLGGESHAYISILSERLFARVGESVVETMDENQGYELIVTGHSLGGGATLCINLLLHNDSRFKNRAFRAFAFAAPPVFATSTSTVTFPDGTIKTAVNYIHQNDEVPFMSGDSVRHRIAAISHVEQELGKMGLWGRVMTRVGVWDPSPELVRQVMDTIHNPLVPLPGVPVMLLPVWTNVWLWEGEGGSYNVKLCDSVKLAKSGWFLHPDKLNDHLPSRYEHALLNLDA